MPAKLQEKDWDTLLKRIDYGKCTPFLGAGAAHGVIPVASEIAERWAQENAYPLSDCKDLARVAQFLAVDRGDPMFPKEEMASLFSHVQPPDFSASDEPHGALASLPLPTFITTNYDNLMVQALQSHRKDPKLELCRWNKYIKNQPSVFDLDPGFQSSPANPIVYHLHGYWEVPESLVLTEDDYLDFLVNISRDQALIPPLIQKALTGASLLFIGYRLADWNFRVLFRGLVSSMEASLRRLNIAVQLPPGSSEPSQQRAQQYLTEYFKNAEVRVYWGEAREFCAELKTRWEQFKGGGTH
jgi:hypothetical protein